MMKCKVIMPQLLGFALTTLGALMLLGSAAFASNIQIEVFFGQSNLNLTVNPNESVTPGSIRGRIRTDVATQVQVYVNSTDVMFSSGNASFRALLTGTIGGRPVSSAPVTMAITPNEPLLIDLRFDIPAGQLSQGRIPAGFYPSIPLSIYALSTD